MDPQRRTTPDPLKARAGPPVDPLEAMLRAGTNGSSADAAHLAAAPAGEPGDITQRSHTVSGRHIDEHAREILWDTLNTEPWTTDFFQTVRRIEALYPELPGFGWSHRASEDALRFCQKPSLAFPPCTLAEYDPPRGDAPSRLFVNFIGLLGPNGPMPLHFTEYAFDREKHHKDRTLARFLDIFHHRIASLFYRAWATSQMPASFDRCLPVPDAQTATDMERQQILLQDSDRYAVYVGSLFGLGQPGVRHRDAVSDRAKLHFAGRLVGYHRGAEGLRAILQDYFQIPVMVEEFAGRWLDVPERERCRLGSGIPRSATLGSAGGLGGAVMGGQVWDVQGAVRVRFGPMDYASYERFLPGAPASSRVESWVRNYVGDEFAWEVVLELKASEVPRVQLGRREVPGGTLGSGGRLGWTTWCRSTPIAEHRCDVVLRSRY